MSLADILQVYAADYIEIGKALQALTHHQNEFDSARDVLRLPADERVEYAMQLNTLREHCQQIKLRVSEKLAETAARRLDLGVIGTWAELRVLIESLEQAVRTELEERVFLFVPTERAGYWQEFPDAPFDLPFGLEVAERFPSAMTDAREAYRCIALGADTASVFHAMCCLERGLRALARKFSVPFEYRNWENVLNEIAGAVNAQGWTSSKEERQFFADLVTDFRHFKDAWRNHVMHGRAEYKFDAARRILTSVRDFMANIAGRLSDQP